MEAELLGLPRSELEAMGEAVFPPTAMAKRASVSRGLVGTLSFFDVGGEYQETVYTTRMPEYREETLEQGLEEELSAVLEDCPTVQVALASDGALTHWEHPDRMNERVPDGVAS